MEVVGLEVAAAGIGCVCVDSLFNSMEVLKVRAQLDSDGRPVSLLARQLVSREGARVLLLPGLGATWLRGLTYTGFRIGGYPEMKRQVQQATGWSSHELRTRISSGLLTGSLGAALFTPIDLVRVRMQAAPAEFAHVPAHRRTLYAFARVIALGGWSSLYTGWSACVLRAAVISAAQLATYDATKAVVKRWGLREGPKTHTACSLFSGLVAQTVVQPADTVKTVMLNAAAPPGLVACFRSIWRSGGPVGLFRGYMPAVLRQGPVIALQMPLIEEIRRLFGLGYM